MNTRTVSLLIVSTLMLLLPQSLFAASLESQFRSDLRAVIAASWPKLPRESVSQRIDEAIAEVKQDHPAFLKEVNPTEKPVTEDEVRRLYGEVRKLSDGKSSGEVIEYYSRLWGLKQLSATQRVLFYRSLQIYATPQTKQKRANKAPEPTPGSVTPRAIERASK